MLRERPGVVITDSPGEVRGELGKQARLRRDPLEGVADLTLGTLAVAEVGDEDAGLRADHGKAAGTGKAGQPAQFAIASGRSRPGGRGRRRSAGPARARRPQRRAGLRARRSRSSSRFEELERLAVALGPLARNLGDHEPVEHREPPPVLARRRRRGGPRPPARARSRARRGSPSCSASRRPGLSNRRVGELGQAVQPLDVFALVIGLKEARPRGRARRRSA